jgi:hypothetical protein
MLGLDHMLSKLNSGNKERRVELAYLRRFWIKFNDLDFHKYMVPDLGPVFRAPTFDGRFFWD